jgi:demethylmenaquinone methyltransferase/2-methoxy-6-polyprenyl-1,4-benzoquinol methylase
VSLPSPPRGGSAGAVDPPAIRRMFDRIAGRYDLLNSLISLGQHRRWKRLAAAAASLSPGDLALDVATGTGDIAFALADGGARVIGLDFAAGMLALGRQRGRGRPVWFVRGDALRLPFPDDTFGAATIGFTLRNLTSRACLFAELARVTRPGGRVVVLETSQPRCALLRALYHGYLRAAASLAPLLSEGAAYRHLARTVIAFPPAEEIADEFGAAGLQRVLFRRLFLGTVAVHVGEVGREAKTSRPAGSRAARNACLFTDRSVG